MKTLIVFLLLTFIAISSYSQTIQPEDSITNIELVKAANFGQAGMIIAACGSLAGAALTTRSQSVTTGLIVIGVSTVVGVICNITAWGNIRKAGIYIPPQPVNKEN